MAPAAYCKILLKLSGEALAAPGEKDLSFAACQQMALKIKELHILGVRIGVVIGGGNIFRGAALAAEFVRDRADAIGMLATIINALTLKEAVEQAGMRAAVLSALECPGVVKKYSLDRAAKYFGEGKVVLFAGGTGNPYFSTDTAAALRACEMGADLLVKGTKVAGIYDRDPMLEAGAKKYDTLTYSEVLNRKLAVMDATAIALCRDNRIPVCVIDIFEKGALSKAVLGEKTGTLVTGD